MWPVRATFSRALGLASGNRQALEVPLPLHLALGVHRTWELSSGSQASPGLVFSFFTLLLHGTRASQRDPESLGLSPRGTALGPPNSSLLYTHPQGQGPRIKGQNPTQQWAKPLSVSQFCPSPGKVCVSALGVCVSVIKPRVASM